MNTSPLAGTLPTPSMLVDVPRLITAYYTEVPDPSVAAQRVAFGTSGHRGSAFARAFNERHILAITQAICHYRRQQQISGPLYLGVDTHALSVPAFVSALEVLAANEVEIMISDQDEFTPTPAISHAILTYNRGRKTGLADGIVITPSHNPPEDGGFKYNPPSGGPADTGITDWIQNQANECLGADLRGVKRIPYEKARRASTTHPHNYREAYVGDLASVIDLDVIRGAKIKLGVDPLGGAGVHYWQPIAERYGLNLHVVSDVVDPTFRFMTLDWDGRIRMDCSSPDAMHRLIGLKDQYEVAFACDTDHDRHGIVTRSAGLLPPNHYLAVAILYLFQNRPQWPKDAAVGKTIVSSQMIDRVATKLSRKLREVPVGFKWFVDGLLDGSLGFGGEESAGASFLRRDGTVWTTDKDGMIAGLLAAEMTARLGRDPGEIYQELTREFGAPAYERVEAPATPEQKEQLKKLSAKQVRSTELAGEKIEAIITNAPDTGASIGGLKVMTKNGWFAARPSGTEDVYKIYAESFRGVDHLRRIQEEAQTIVNEAVGPSQAGEEAMNEQTGDRNRIYTFPPVDVEGADPLVELALDMRWSWNHLADEIWQQLDPGLWDVTHNPWVVLQTVSRDQLTRALGDASFRQKVDDLLHDKRQAAESPAWFQRQHGQAPLTCVGYFSMEFMLSEALPIYSGGLGNVAGDQLKAAADLGVPVVGIGLLYQQGYFRQVINRAGEQTALYPYNDPGQLPITPVRAASGEWLRVELSLPGYSLWLRAWQVEVGRLKLYLLDSNDAANFPAHRGITSELYGGGSELRLQQELVLGIGGWRLLGALGIQPEVCHLNEGHAAFAVLERARSFMERTGQDFETALAVTRAGNLFTTHTAVAAGFDRFAPSLIAQYLGAYAERKIGLKLDDLLALGRQNPQDGGEAFNMAYLAVRGSGGVNGVSRLHGNVSRRLFASLFPRWPEAEVPVGHVTNGVHMPSWNSKAAEKVWSQKCGEDHWLGTAGTLEQNLRCVSDAELWQLRATTALPLVQFARQRLRQQLIASDAPQSTIDEVDEILDPNALTLGFARRFATYKRPNLLLRDPQRLLRLLTNPHRPVQLILAGKAHPADWPGQVMIREWIEFIRRPEVRRHVVFLADYDMLLTQQLVQGVDVWINTPRRPWEASGTSGMKVLVNGGLNVSELDGWWAEAYTPEVGWAIGDGREHGEDPGWDAAEAAALYDILEHSVVPEFYDRDPNGIPTRWVARMRESMARLAPQFSADRAVREYTEQHYLPSAAAYRERAAGDGAAGKQIVDWRKTVERKWAALRFGDVTVQTKADQHIFEAQVYLDDLDPKAVTVELYADGVNGGEPARVEMQRARELVGAANGYVYSVVVPASRPAADYTARIVPHRSNISVPLEASSILWQR